VAARIPICSLSRAAPRKAESLVLAFLRHEAKLPEGH